MSVALLAATSATSPTPTPAVMADSGPDWLSIVLGGVVAALIGAAVSFGVARFTIQHQRKDRQAEQRHELGAQLFNAAVECNHYLCQRDEENFLRSAHQLAARMGIVIAACRPQHPEFTRWLTSKGTQLLSTIQDNEQMMHFPRSAIAFSKARSVTGDIVTETIDWNLAPDSWSGPETPDGFPCCLSEP